MASPAWLRGLKNLSKRGPDSVADFGPIHVEITAQQNDRAAALISASIVEDMLRMVIRSQLVPLNETEEDALFGRDAPLSTFSDLIRIGHAFGIFDKQIRNDLDRIREIRNAFAHSLLPINFSTPEIVTACNLFEHDDKNVYLWMIAAKRKYILNAFRLVSTLGKIQRKERSKITPAVSYAEPKANT